MINEENGYYTWNKLTDEKINQYFSTGELSCRCTNDSCQQQKISIDLIERLVEVRQSVDDPIIITSGFRCAKHQQALRNQGLETAKGISTHELGNAVDIKCKNKSIDELLDAVKDNFTSYGVSKRFIHVDTRNKSATWTYST